MTSADGFIRAIIEEPDDDALRLIYADWLDERGDPRGRFIRVQCRLAVLPPDDPDRFELEDEERDLLKAHEDEWAAPFVVLSQAGLFDSWNFVCGFVERVCLTADILRCHGDRLFRDHPVRHVRLWGSSESAWTVRDCPLLGRVETLDVRDLLDFSAPFLRLIASKHLGRLRSLVAPSLQWPALQGLFQSPLMRQLRSLDLNGNRSVTDRVLRALSSTPTASALQTLCLNNANCTWRGLHHLLASRHLTSLSTLELQISNLFPSGVDSAAVFERHTAMPVMSRLTSLNLSGTGLGVRGLMPLLAGLRNIQHLGLNDCQLGRQAGVSIADSKHLAGLRSLHLDRNPLSDTGVKALASSLYLTGLRSLSLRKSQVGGPGIQGLADSRNLANVTDLDLGENYVNLKSINALAESPNLARVTRLGLALNRLGPEAVRLLMASKTLSRLTTLDLGGNPLGGPGMQELASMPSAARLRSLCLNVTHVDDSGAYALIASPYLTRLNRLEMTRDATLSEDACQRLHARFGKALVMR
jgi:uncharacterized protein (TIGR02996 family)